MPVVEIWIHAVWTTKNRNPLLTDELMKPLFKHIRDYADKKGFYIDFINGVSDHVHCLLSLKANQALSEAMKFIKGESSHWINQNNLTSEKFSWQNEFYAASVCVSQLQSLRKYIKNQKRHHREINFETEMNKLKTEKSVTQLPWV